MQIVFLYFLYIALTDYYWTPPCTVQITHTTHTTVPLCCRKLFYFLPPASAMHTYSYIRIFHFKL